ncbi:exosome complex component RRP42 [Marchantia polymorpha subsp. ruderalis]|uniref:Ribosomal RNA-processing protein 42 n=2 Tax=Marchantia polymorpha TaxID=3197 RepID=A0AAF6BHZ3_MARPO|nr:hypothetical protein MARPO_0032s0043 [Marchantia polymorpha]BBN11627.1 hypothetical protein Mp_5g13500 [Marchantia polymorpha subsp. ruderalis]|eukprot:PTQ41841.1 hypothetical protein MARPO_0032s0043 [Marchantia polymorpha]
MVVGLGLSSAEKSYIAGGIAVDLRGDGRGRHHFRDFSIDTSIIPQANGSARLRLGGTDVIASVKAELCAPPPGRPHHGKLEINVECSPTAAPEFEGRGGEELSMDLSRALQRSFLGGASGAGAAIDLASLVVLEGKLCWMLYFDGLVLSSDGNLLDALSIAMKAALSNCGLPKVEITSGTNPEDDADFELNEEEFTPVDTSRFPVIVTLTKVGKHYIVDATAEEESQMTAAVSVAVNKKGSICGLTKRGGTGLDPSVLLDMISVAKRVSQTLITSIDAEISAAESRHDDQ